MFFVNLKHILVNLSKTGCYWHHFRGAQFRRNLSCHNLNLLIDELPCLKRGHTFLEHNGDEREPESRHRPNLSYVHDVAHRYFHGHGDELFHLLRGKCRRHGDNLNLIVCDVRHGIHRQCKHRPYTAKKQKESRQSDK